MNSVKNPRLAPVKGKGIPKLGSNLTEDDKLGYRNTKVKIAPKGNTQQCKNITK